MARTYLAHDALTGDRVVVQLLPDRGVPRSFRLGAGLVHPRLFRILDWGPHDEGAFLVLAHVPGTALAVPPCGLDAERLPGFLALVAHLLHALRYLHLNGLVHLDLKPANVIIDAAGLPTLVDPGFLTPAGERLTAPRGTPAYLAPEALGGGLASPANDLYALGAFMFHLATGQLPSGGTRQELLTARLSSLPPRARTLNPTIPEPLDDLIALLLGREPGDRPSDARTVLAELAMLGPLPDEPLEAPTMGQELALAGLMQAFEASAGSGGWLEIDGDPGSGKTRLLQRFQARLRAEDRAQVRWSPKLGIAPLDGQALVLLLDGPEGASDEAMARARAIPGAFVVIAGSRPGGPARLRLLPLDRPEASALLRAWDSDLPDEIMADLVAFAAGNPGLLQLGLQAWRRTGKLPSVLEACARWLAPLSAPERTLLAQLAILSGEGTIDPTPWSPALPDGWESTLESLVALGVVRRTGQRTAPVTALRGLVPDRRSAWRLLRHARHLPEVPPAILCALALAAGEAETAGPLCLMMARQALDGDAPGRALSLVAQGLELADEPLRSALLEVHGDARRQRGDGPGAVASYREALLGPASEGDAGRRWIGLGKAHLMANEPRAAVAAFRRGLALGIPEGERTRGLLALARALHGLGFLQESRDACQQALDRALAVGDPARVAEARAFLGHLLCSAAPELARQHLAAALTTYRALEDAVGTYDTLVLLGDLDLAHGRLTKAAMCFEEARDICRRLGCVLEEALVMVNLALVGWVRGDLAAMREAATGAHELARRAGDPGLQSLSVTLVALGMLRRGQGAHARAAFESAWELHGKGVDPLIALLLHLIEADGRVFLGDGDGALLHAREALALIPEGTGTAWRWQAHRFAGEALLALGEAEAAGREFDLARNAAPDHPIATAWLAWNTGRCNPAALCEQADALGMPILWLVTALALPPGTLPTERALTLAEAQDDPDLIARLCLLRADGLRARGAHREADRVRLRGEELLGRLLVHLAPDARERFLAAPWRRSSAPTAWGAHARIELGLLALRGRRLEQLNGLSRALAEAQDALAVIRLASGLVREVTGAERCLFLRMPAGPGPGRPIEVWPPELATAPFSRSVARMVALQGSEACVIDLDRDELLHAETSVQALSLQSVMGAPLRSQGKLLGVLYADSRVALGSFGPEDLEFLQAIADHAALAITRAELHAALQREIAGQREALSRIHQASHDLRSPLASIQTCSQALLRGLMGPLSAEQAEVLGGIVENSRSLIAMVTEILDAARLEAGTSGLAIGPVSLLAIVDEALALLLPLASEAGATLVVDREALQAFPPLQADRRKLHQVVLNLLSNAVKYAPGARICIGGRHGRTSATFWVADEGPGIASERLATLFVPFAGDAASALGVPGSGLGLSLVKELAERHEARIAVASEPGRGTTVTLHWPVGDSTAPTFLNHVPGPTHPPRSQAV